MTFTEVSFSTTDPFDLSFELTLKDAATDRGKTLQKGVGRIAVVHSVLAAVSAVLPRRTVDQHGFPMISIVGVTPRSYLDPR
ncbi:MAG: hypothetical protein ACRDS9_12930 [Pseudonocardiaceae bacterium]